MPRRARSPFKLYQRTDSQVWWVHFVVKGQRHRLSTGETDRDRASERAAALWQEARARAGDPVPAGSVDRALSGLAAELVEEAERAGRADTYARDLEVDLRLHILPRWPRPELVTSIGWDQAREDLHAEGQSWRSVQRIASHLRSLLRFCVRKGALQNEPVIHAPARELIKREEAQRDGMNRTQRNAFLAHLKKRGLTKAYRCYRIMFFSGFRKSTVQRLLPTWIDLKAHRISIPPSSSKNSRARVYFLHPEAERAIRDQLADLKRQGKLNFGQPVFGRFDHSNVFWAACKRLGFVDVDEQGKVQGKRGLTPHHVGRHTAGTMLVEAGARLEDRLAAGGWETVEAAQRYDHGEQFERSRRALRRLK
jgi:site-specific recombinase XerC